MPLELKSQKIHHALYHQICLQYMHLDDQNEANTKHTADTFSATENRMVGKLPSEEPSRSWQEQTSDFGLYVLMPCRDD